MAVQLPRWEIEVGKVAVRAQDCIDSAHAFEQLTPIDGRHQPHARDDIPDGHVRRAFALLLQPDDTFRSGSLSCQGCVQPANRRRDPWIFLAQPADQLDRERGRQWRADALQNRACLFCHLLASAQQPVSQ